MPLSFRRLFIYSIHFDKVLLTKTFNERLPFFRNSTKITALWIFCAGFIYLVHVTNFYLGGD